ncbi:MAG: class I SAM-dependent methyltransferase [Promethearchaeota archaeon]
MGITIINWSDRFSEQLKWTKELREYLYKKISLGFGKKKILEIGCGTGELLKEIGKKFKQELYGIDIDEERIKTANKNLKQQGIKAELKHVDFLNNNFKDQFFEVIITNYLFLWIKNLKKCFDEIYRILNLITEVLSNIPTQI